MKQALKRAATDAVALAGLLVVMSAVAIGLNLGPVVHSARAQAPLNACSLLTKDLALKVTSAANKALFDVLPPREEKVGATGSACDYGDIRIQITGVVADATFQKNPQYVAVAGLGDRAWFRDNRGQYAELLVTSGTRSLGIQMGVPSPGTIEKVKANAITLARELLPKLK